MFKVIISCSILLASTVVSIHSHERCSSDSLAVYRVVLTTEWTEERFPNQYPHNAQWLGLYGQSHSQDHILFRVGEVPISPVRDYLQNGTRNQLLVEGEENDDVFDQFTSEPIRHGADTANAVFLVDDEHSYVSFIAKMIPSPDWFVGIDNFQLCISSKWLDSAVLQLSPIDGGTSDGLSFTSSPSTNEVPDRVHKITSQYPPQENAAFYYPDLLELPSIATVAFIKVKEFSGKDLWTYIREGIHTMYEEVSEVTEKPATKLKLVTIQRNTAAPRDLVEKEGKEEQYDFGLDIGNVEPSPKQKRTVRRSQKKVMLKNVTRTDTVLALAKGKSHARSTHLPRHYRQKLNKAIHMKKYRTTKKPRLVITHSPQHIQRGARSKHKKESCVVSPWSSWSPCSQPCGNGTRIRARQIVKITRGSSRSCPKLIEVEACGDAELCRAYKFSDW